MKRSGSDYLPFSLGTRDDIAVEALTPPTTTHQQKTTLLAGILCVLYVSYVSYKALIRLAEGSKSDKYLIRHIRHWQVKLFFADDDTKHKHKHKHGRLESESVRESVSSHPFCNCLSFLSPCPWNG